MQRFTFLLLIFLNGCTFAGDPDAGIFSPAGFLSGIWDGAIFFWALILSIFSNITVVTHHNSGWPYALGYLIGLFGLSHNAGIFLGFISLIAYFI